MKSIQNEYSPDGFQQWGQYQGLTDPETQVSITVFQQGPKELWIVEDGEEKRYQSKARRLGFLK